MHRIRRASGLNAVAMWRDNRKKGKGDDRKPEEAAAAKSHREKNRQTSGASEATPTSPSANIEVYNIKIQQDFEKKAILPPVNVWNRVVDPGSFLIATLRVTVKRSGLLFDRQLAAGFYTCVLGKQGHLVIYTQHLTNEGYAVNLRKANRVVLKFINPATNNMMGALRQQQLLQHEQKSKRGCKVTAQWRFGSIVINLPDRRMAEWCWAIIGTTSMDSSPGQFRPASMHSAMEEDTLPGPSTAESDERKKATTADKKEQTDGNNPEPIIIEPGTWSAMNGQRFSTKNADQYDTLDTLSDVYGEPAVPADDLCPADDHHQSEDNHQNEEKPVEGEKEEDVALETDDVDVKTNKEDNTCSDSMKSDKEEGGEVDGEDKVQDESDEQTGDHNNSSDARPSPLKRRVTFSNLRTIFEVPKATEEAEHDQSMEGEDDNIPPVLMKLVAASTSASEESKEKQEQHIAGPALDQMRIVGQHGTTTTTAPLVDDAVDEQHDMASSSLLDTSIQFPSQAERFDRTRHLFESVNMDGTSKGDDDDKPQQQHQNNADD